MRDKKSYQNIIFRKNYTRKYVFTFFVLLILSGCQNKWRTDVTQTILQKDQVYEQGFTVDKQLVYEKFDQTKGIIDLSSQGLVGIPNLCSLVQEEDHEKVRILNLMNNKIRVVQQDFSCFKNLKVINLSYNNIVSIQSFGSLPQLKKLLLHKNNLTRISMPYLPELEELNLGYNKLQDLIGLEKLQNLRTLELQHNTLESLVGIESLQQLEKLKLEFNKLTNVDFIEQLDALILITAKGNNLKEEVIQKLQKINDTYVEKYLGQDVISTASGSLSTKKAQNSNTKTTRE